MTTSTLSTKGQLVIPKAVREYMGLHPGDRLDFVVQSPLQKNQWPQRQQEPQ